MISIRMLGLALANLLTAFMFAVWARATWLKMLATQSFPEKWMYSLLIIQCTVTALFFLSRHSSIASSWNPSDVLFAWLGSFSVCFFRIEHTHHFYLLGISLQIIGALLALWGSISLNRSWGILPANRGVRMTGLYHWVRHPIYMSYLIFCVGLLINNFILHNLLIFGVHLLSQLIRIFAEERLLSSDPNYRQYKSLVPWRLVPHVY